MRLCSCKVMVSCNQFRPVLAPDHVQKHAVFHDRKSSHHFTDSSSLPDADELTNDQAERITLSNSNWLAAVGSALTSLIVAE